MVDELPEGSLPPPAHTREDGFRIEGPLCTPERAWAFVADTDWLNRTADAGAVSDFRVDAEADGFAMLRAALPGPLGVKLPFREVHACWVVGSFLRQVRDFDSPLVARSDFRATLEPAGEGRVRPIIDMKLWGPAWSAPVRRGVSLARMKDRWGTALARINEVPLDEGPVRALGAEAASAIRRWRGAADGAVVERFERHFRVGRATDLARMRAFELADHWQLERESVLEALLAGVGVGAVELFWSVRCTRCYGQVGGGRLLSDLADHAHCAGCGIQSAVDLGDNVEVLFTPHPSVGADLGGDFCTLFPKVAPAQLAVLSMVPGQRVQAPLFLPPGPWRIGPGGTRTDVGVESGATGDARVRWQSALVDAQQVRSGPVLLDVVNDTDARQRLHLTRQGGATPMVPASLLTTRDAFRRQLGHQVLAPDLRLGVRSIALVFTDLSGSTAMYEELGDARAFAVVRDHFAVLRKAAADHDGTVVKTIGDAVMASFYDAPSALQAAFDMLEGFNRWVVTLGLAHPPALKVGVHVGSALVVHSDQAGLDYFGGTVNLAARAQGAAASGEVVWTDAVHAMERARAVVETRGYTAVASSAPLKGIGEVRLWRAGGGAS